MSDLIVQAFAHAEQRAAAQKDMPVLLLLDEADALAARRDTEQMHHEDKAGLNTLLQRLDNLRLTRLRLAAIFITNRPELSTQRCVDALRSISTSIDPVPKRVDRSSCRPCQSFG